ncbi:MAG: hypothetical protein ACC682_11975 [Gemmatimonadota bacterium]
MTGLIRLAPGVLGLLVLSSCASDPFAVDGESNCRQRDQLISCIDRAEYLQEETVFWTIRSARSDTVFFDVCATELSRDRGVTAGFSAEYRPQLNCGSDVDRDEIVTQMIRIPPGETLAGENVLGVFEPQGRYRMNLWVVDETGRRLSLGPYFTPLFTIFPSVGN